MGKVILFNLISLDGFFAGPDGDIDWHNVDEEFNEFAIQQMHSVDALIFGRVTYELMVSYWPTPEAIQNDPEITVLMNAVPKLVFSKTLEKAGWHNTRLLKNVSADEINQLKQGTSKDIFIFGSADLATTFIQLGLIDEYRVMVNPMVLGSGQPLFKGLKQRLQLKLTQSRVFQSGNVLLYYSAR